MNILKLEQVQRMQSTHLTWYIILILMQSLKLIVKIFAAFEGNASKCCKSKSIKVKDEGGR